MNNESIQDLKIDSNVIHVWKTRHIPDEGIEPYMSVLSQRELERARKFRFDEHRNIFVKTRGLQKILIAKYLQKEPKEINIEFGSNGKPFYKNKAQLRFNASHAGELILLAFTLKNEVGIDVEKMKDHIDVVSIAKHFFSQNEIVKLISLAKPLRQEAFFTCWSRKEAFIKAIGDGLSFPLDQFEVSFTSDEPVSVLETKWDSAEKDAWTILNIPLEKDYKAALAIKALGQSVEYFDWT